METVPFYEALKQLLLNEASAIRRVSWEPGIVVYLEKAGKGMETRMTAPYLSIRTWKSGQPTEIVPWNPAHHSIFSSDWECEYNFEARS